MTGNVKSQSPAVKCFSRTNFLFRKPFACRKSIFHFIPVGIFHGRSQDFLLVFPSHMSNSLQIFQYFFRFELKLGLIGHMLPFTSAANAEISTCRLASQRRILMKLNGFSFIIIFPFFEHPHIHHVSRRRERNKNHPSVRSFPHTFAFGTGIRNFNFFQ